MLNKTYKVVIVPVYDTPIDIAAIRQILKDIYGPVGVHWEVSQESGYHYNGENKFFDSKSGLLNSYTPEMRQMNADFADQFKNGSLDPKANYVFILKYSGGETLSRDVAGFMPRGGQFGYIFTKDFKSDHEILQTIAHELGHGKLLLKHTFDKDYGIAQGATDNLMDYVPGKSHLAKWQWDIVSDPGIAQGVFDRDQDGMFPRLTTANDDISRFINLYQCGIRQGQAFDFYKPGQPNDGLLVGSNMTIGGKANVRIRLRIKSDMLNYIPKINSGQLSSINNERLDFDSFWIEVSGMTISDFAKYLDEGEMPVDINKISNLLKENNFREAYKLLYQLSPCALKQLSYEDKILILGDFANTIYLEDSKDHITITLLQSIIETPEQTKKLYEWLCSHPKEVISLYRGIDDEQTNNQFSALLADLFMQQNRLAELSEKLTPEQYFVYDENLKTYTEIKYQSDRLHFAQVIPSPNRELAQVSPMQTIGIWFTNSSTDPDGTKDVLVYAPAICIKNMLQSYADKNMREFMYAGAQVTGLAVGYGFAVGGGVAILRIAGVVEMANRSVSLSLQSTSIVNSLAQSQEGQLFMEWWPTVSKTADVATIIAFAAIPQTVEKSLPGYQKPGSKRTDKENFRTV